MFRYNRTNRILTEFNTMSIFIYSRLFSTKLYTISDINSDNNKNSNSNSNSCGRYQEIIKKSSFIATIYDIHSKSHAMEILKSEYDEKSTHNCYAYRVLSTISCGNDNSDVNTNQNQNQKLNLNVESVEFASHDDGEVSGTAGKQILTVLERENLVNSLILVIRYYGGVKLGVGGLARAYSGAARGVVNTIDKQELIPYTICTLTGPVNEYYMIHNIISQSQVGPSGPGGAAGSTGSIVLFEESTNETQTQFKCMVRMDMHILDSFKQKIYSFSRKINISWYGGISIV